MAGTPAVKRIQFNPKPALIGPCKRIGGENGRAVGEPGLTSARRAGRVEESRRTAAPRKPDGKGLAACSVQLWVRAMAPRAAICGWHRRNEVGEGFGRR